MTDHRRPQVLAHAAWIGLYGVRHTFQEAVMRGDVAEAKRIRDEAHAKLDAILDLDEEATIIARSSIPE